MKLEHQLDLFLPNPTEADLAHFKGSNISPDVFLITAPKWDNIGNRWTALADVRGMLCLIEVSVKTYDTDNSSGR